MRRLSRQGFLVIFVQQHGQQGQFVLSLPQALSEREKTLHPLGLQAVPRAEIRLQQGGNPLGDDSLHIGIPGQRAFLEFDAEFPGDLLQLDFFQGSDQGKGHPAGPGPSGAPDPMDVNLRVLRRLVLNDMGQFLDIDAPGRHIGSHHEPQRPFPNPGHHLFPRPLGQVGTQLIGIVAETLKDHRQIMHGAFGVAEDNGRNRVFNLDDPDQAPVLFHSRGHIIEMVGPGHMDLVPAQAEELGLMEKLAGQTEHKAREGGRKHVAVDPMGGQVFLDLLHVRVKTHGKEAVGLIKDQDLQMFQRKGALEQMIQYPARRADHQLDPLLEGLQLRPVTHTAINGDGTHAHHAAQDLGLPGHLVGQFPGGDQHQGLADGLLRVDPVQDGQEISAGLAAPGLGLNHQVPPGLKVGNGLGLDRQKAAPAGLGRRLLQSLGQVLQGNLRQPVFGLNQGVFLNRCRVLFRNGWF